MAKDLIVELTLVVRIDRHIDEDLETIINEAIQSDGTIEITELSRVGMTGTIDLPRLWLPTTPSSQPPTIPPPKPKLEEDDQPPFPPPKKFWKRKK